MCAHAYITPISRCHLRETLNIASDLHKRREAIFRAWVMVLSHYGGLGRSRPLPEPYKGYRLSIHAHCAAIPYVFRSGLVDGSTFPVSDHHRLPWQPFGIRTIVTCRGNRPGSGSLDVDPFGSRTIVDLPTLGPLDVMPSDSRTTHPGGPPCAHTSGPVPQCGKKSVRPRSPFGRTHCGVIAGLVSTHAPLATFYSHSIPRFIAHLFLCTFQETIL